MMWEIAYWMLRSVEPGAQVLALDFPSWLRVTHFLNFLFITFLMRSGIEVLSAHPKLYWSDHCIPGTEWLRFTKKQMPKDELWTGRDEEESFSSLIALPGHRNLGLGRLWHFFTVTAWILTGLAYVALLFGTGEWRRLIPTSWEIFPQAWHAMLGYLSLHIVESPGYNGLQQLIYAFVVFVLAPLSISTGAAMSPAIAGRFPWYIRLFGGRQKARSLHFISLAAFTLFIVGHVTMVVAHGLSRELALIVLGTDQADWSLAVIIASMALVVVVAAHIIATRSSLHRPRSVQHFLQRPIDPIRRLLFHHLVSRQHYSRNDISPLARVNGRPPVDEEYARLARDHFANWKLEIGGLVGNPLRLSLADLRTMSKESQITKQNCIQGWCYVAEWTGVPLRHIIEQCRPLPSAKYLLFRGYDDKSKTEVNSEGPGIFYETIELDLANQPQTILAYDFNGEPLTIPRGAPLRLRLESYLGFKMVKYIKSIDFITDYQTLGEGQGGWREDFQHYSQEAGI